LVLVLVLKAETIGHRQRDVNSYVLERRAKKESGKTGMILNAEEHLTNEFHVQWR
jgi:hypothetical protein